MMAEKIYVVMGTTGEYSDRTEWTIAAYSDEEEAKKHVELATERALIEEANSEINGWDYQPKNDYDTGMQIDYTGTGYYINEVELFVDVFQYKLEM